MSCEQIDSHACANQGINISTQERWLTKWLVENSQFEGVKDASCAQKGETC
jgi:hypothetical protein